MGTNEPAGSTTYSETYSIIRAGETSYPVVHCRPVAFSYCYSVTVSASTANDSNPYNNTAVAY
jgi:hypothetical protein